MSRRPSEKRNLYPGWIYVVSGLHVVDSSAKGLKQWKKNCLPLNIFLKTFLEVKIKFCWYHNVTQAVFVNLMFLFVNNNFRGKEKDMFISTKILIRKLSHLFGLESSSLGGGVKVLKAKV